MRHIFILSLFSVLLFLFSVPLALAGNIDSVYKYAWAENIGWMNFNTPGDNIVITDTQLAGNAWIQNYGWMNLQPPGSGVRNDGNGNLSGSAWGEQVGYIDFTGVTIDSQGYFHGYANGTVTGKISFNCDNTSTCGLSDFKTRTSWQKTQQSSGGGGGGSRSKSVTPKPALVSTVVPLPKVTLAVPTVQCAAGKVSLFRPMLTRDMQLGSTEADVVDLQRFLNTHGYFIAKTGPGSLGKESVYFKTLTQTALIKFQKQYGDKKVLVELGKVGPNTRALINDFDKKSHPEITDKLQKCPVELQLCPDYLTKYIQYGTQNDVGQVKKLQTFLMKHGFPKLTESGIYDKKTRDAVIDFQNKYAADILGPWEIQKGTGHVYKTTVRKINQIHCEENK